MSSRTIFISHGTPYTAAQERFYARFKEVLAAKGCEAATIGENKHGVRQPVELARDAIAKSEGVAVIAFKRIEIKKGVDKPDSTESSSVDGRVLSTVWNHLEAAMAYSRRLPLLILVERGVHREGMLSKRLEWDAFEIEPDLKVLNSDEFTQRLDSWLSYVDEYKKGSPKSVDSDELTLPRIFGTLSVGKWWALLGAVFLILSAIATTAFKLGQLFPHAK